MSSTASRALCLAANSEGEEMGINEELAAIEQRVHDLAVEIGREAITV